MVKADDEPAPADAFNCFVDEQRFYGTHVEGVDLWIRPVDQLLREVTPFHQQHVHLRRQKFCFQENSKTKEFLRQKHFVCVVCKSVEAYIALTREEAFFKSQQLHVPDVRFSHSRETSSHLM